MGIPKSQLETWTTRGAEVTAKATHETVRLAISNGNWRYNHPDTYLQGSYRNLTNIRGDSDVDIVAQLDTVYISNIEELDLSAIRTYKSVTSTSTYTWYDFKADALRILRARFGYNAVVEGKKCLTIAGENGRLPADVLLCFEYRKFRQFRHANESDFISGMAFYIPSEFRWAVNYPKQHINNGIAKNTRTYAEYKPTVRMFKNARRYLVDNNEMDKKIAPSYFLEGLLSNVPDSYFANEYSDRYLAILDWLFEAFNNAKIDTFTCQNGEQYLFGSVAEQWSKTNALITLGKLLDLWKEW